MNSIKMIGIDLDGTLLDDNHMLSDYTIDVWNKVKQKGIHILPVTGRPTSGMLTKIPMELCEYSINYNGVRITHFTNEGNSEIVWDKSLEWDIAKKTLYYASEHFPDIHIQLYANNILYAKHANERTEEYIDRTGLTYVFLDDWSKLLKPSVTKIMAVADHEDLLPLQVQLSSMNEITAVFSMKHYLEIFNAQASKGNAILYLADMLKIQQTELLGIGDSFNDVTLLEACGHAFVMKNALDEVAPHIQRTDYTNNDNGVAKLLEKILDL